MTREGLIAATTSTSIKPSLSAQNLTLFIASIVNYIGGDVRQLKLSRESIGEGHYRFLAEEGGQKWDDYIDLTAKKMLAVTF